MQTIMPTMAKICSHCKIELAAAGMMLPIGTIRCQDCPRLLCGGCCVPQHRRAPLHRVQVSHDSVFSVGELALILIQVWDGGWQRTTLAEEGLEYQLGHGGDACMWPLDVTPMTVIDWTGCQTVQLKYCGCGGFERGAVGRWNQILANGWYRAGLVHPQICATFRVLSDEDYELRYQFEPFS
jgi:hypothetical protein